MPDRLTGPAYNVHFAANFLRAIEPYIKHSRSDIHLSRSELNSLLAEAHEWIGEEQFWRREMADARRHLARSIRFRLRQPRAWGLLVASFLPLSWVSSRRSAQSGS